MIAAINVNVNSGGFILTEKKVSKKAKSRPSKAKGTYQVYYLILGLVLSFLSLLALCQWGFLGNFMVNCMRLLVGQAYDLIFILILFFALYLMVKGKLMTISWKKFLGAILVLVAISLALHFKACFPQAAGADSLTSQVYSLFKNELALNQVSQDMGGGLLGVSLYQSFAYLLGSWGSYLLILVLFFCGLFMLVDIRLSDLKAASQAFFGLFAGVNESVYESIDQARDLLEEQRAVQAQKRQVKDQAVFNSNQDEAELEDMDLNEYQSHSDNHEVNPHKTNSLKGRFGHLVSGIFSDGSSSQREVFDRTVDYDLPAKVDRHRDFEPYQAGIPQASQAQRSRQVQAPVLDMDYFDALDHDHPDQFATGQDQTKSVKQEVPIERGGSFTPENYEFPTEPNQAELLEETEVNRANNMVDSNEETELTSAESINDQAKIASQADPVQASSLEEKVSNSESSSTTQLAAQRWQDQAHQAQNLTADDLEASLQAGQKPTPSPKPAKKKAKHQTYKLPGKSLLNKIPPVDQSEEYDRIKHNIEKLERTFESFGVDARVVKANLGPAVTKYEIEPAVGVKVSKIVSLSDDIALALAARDVRMEAPIPGKSLIGIEVPNTQVSPVSFWEIIDAALKSPNLLEVPLGRDVSGQVCLADLTKMPHLLMAGATGSGKSVGMNVIIVSLLMKARPDQVKFLMVDPKKVELTMYNDLPHLLAPVVTNPRKAAKALNNVVQEMERRYELFAETGVRNLDSYNEHVDNLNKSEGTGYEILPKIVVFIDELADLMMVASNEVEAAIIRLAQMARAAGIHMIIATQRPSVDVITGIIKANVPSRLAFAVSSGTDSRTILDSNGAEKLLGKGDMLFQPMGKNKPVRVQGAFISDEEVERITDMIKDQTEPDYDENMVVTDENMAMEQASEDEYFEDAVELIQEQETISISQLQRRFRIGYNRAARLIDDLEAMGYISAADGSKPRQVLINQ
nr:DNA translocase FtsK [Eremococcus coleocola]